MKAQILAMLRERTDYVSGQELCEHFGVSRTAVWKAINQLKKEGYRIEAVQNKGYLLETEAEVFGQNELESRMTTQWAGKPVHFFETIDSTNVRAKLAAEEGAPHGTLIVADRQTAGRGRRGRCWISPAGANAYFTLLLKPELSPDRAPMLTLVMAMAVAKGIGDTVGKTPDIKWPNDIVAKGRKICGILTEMSVERDYIHYIVIGVGVNVGKQDFAPEIAHVASSLEEICGRKVPRATLVANIMKAFETYYDRFLQHCDLTALMEEYNSLLVNCGRQVRVLDPGGEFTALAKGINARGELLVTLEDGSEKEIFAGEVSVRGIYGYT